MSNSTRAPFHDLFKLIVAILLLLLFLFLIWGQKTQTSPESPTTLPMLPPTPSTTLRASPIIVTSSSTSLPLTATPLPTDTPLPSPTATSLPTLTDTPIPAATESPAPETLPTPIVEIPAETNICEAVSRSQLQVGMKATIVRRLNFRSSPGILYNWILTNIPDTQVEIIGGPSCTRYQNGGAYLWWQIKLPNGMIGWSAEASAFGAFYFMEPVQ
ncbi:MAG TPA: hypothetical protein VN653_13330 [Anaerolineales bacterium]|nr:hypothetical protein [Anaerolineales bacterium]